MAAASHGSYNFHATRHPEDLLQGLNNLKSQKQFSDVTLSVNGKEFPCHRVVLASSSSYFKAMFYHDLKESTTPKVRLNQVDADILEQLIDFIYTSKLTITDANVQSLLETADLLQILPVKGACAEYMGRQIDSSNCLGIQQFAELHNCMSLSEKAENFALEEFSQVSKEEEAMSLSKDRLLHYVSSPKVQVQREEDLYELCMNWMKYDKGARSRFLPDLLQHIRFAFINDKYVKENVEKEELLLGSELVSDRLRAANAYKTMGVIERQALTSPLYTSRIYSEVIVTLGGDAGMGQESQVQSYNPLTGKWKDLEDIPISRDRVATAVAIGNNIFVSSRKGCALLYETSEDKWYTLATPLLKERWSHRSVALDGYVYILGGKDVDWSTINSVERYNPHCTTCGWKEVTPMRYAVRNPAATACQGKIYVIGGYSEIDPPPTQCYNPLQDIWTILSPCPLSARQPACCAVTLRGFIYVISDGSGNMYCYDPMTDTWQSKASLTIGRVDPGVTVCNGIIYIFGGYREGHGVVETIEAYDLAEDRWSPVGYMPVAVYRHGCVTIRKCSR
ncbi:kelch-like protein 24 [Ptychodera flava]|uniref:kelch-like protein 24 n=1 Tax=Ptychodera flava TaxID=63121 RepID=UPI00396AA268